MYKKMYSQSNGNTFFYFAVINSVTKITFYEDFSLDIEC